SSVFEANRGRLTLLDWIDAALLPLTLALQATYALQGIMPMSVVYSAEVLPLLAFVWRRQFGAARDAAVAALLILAVPAFYAAHPESPAIEVLGILALSLGALGLHGLRPSVPWVAGSVVLIAHAARLTTNALVSRPAFTFPRSALSRPSPRCSSRRHSSSCR